MYIYKYIKTDWKNYKHIHCFTIFAKDLAVQIN